MTRRGWMIALAIAFALAMIALVSNITSERQLAGQANTLETVRFTVSKVVNSGTAWAGLSVLAGWLVRRPLQAAAAGIVVGELALAAHYAVGQVFGLFDSDAWSNNYPWFIAAAIMGAPLGLVGAVARRTDLWGLAARLLVPIAAIAEPFVVGMFVSSPLEPWPGRVSSTICGVILLCGGLISTALVLRRFAKMRHASQTYAAPDSKLPGIPADAIGKEALP